MVAFLQIFLKDSAIDIGNDLLGGNKHSNVACNP